MRKWLNKRWDDIEHFRRIHRRWATWGVVLLVVFLGYLAAVIIPNIFYPHQDLNPMKAAEAAATEWHSIQYAVTYMMSYNNLPTLPNPVGMATNDMGAFPDATSVAGSPNKLKDPNGNPYRSGDKSGYLLYGHDSTADNSTTELVNYIANRYTKGTYTVDAEGIVTQVTTGFE